MTQSKGSSFERDICRYLSEWWSNGERDDIFWRNRVRVTSKTPNAERQLGDIIAVRPEGIPLTDTLNVEIKRGYSKTKRGKRTKNIPWDVLEVLDGTGIKSDPMLIIFWEQTVGDACVSGRAPFLIFKRDYHSPCVCMARALAAKFYRYKKELIHTPCISIFYPQRIYELRIYGLEEFFKVITPQVIIDISNAVDKPGSWGGALRRLGE